MLISLLSVTFVYRSSFYLLPDYWLWIMIILELPGQFNGTLLQAKLGAQELIPGLIQKLQIRDLSRYFWTAYGVKKSIPGIEYEPCLESSRPCPKAWIYFSSTVDSCYIVSVLEMCWPMGLFFPHTQHITNDNSEIFNSFTCKPCIQDSIPQRNWFLTRNRFYGIDAWGP